MSISYNELVFYLIRFSFVDEAIKSEGSNDSIVSDRYILFYIYSVHVSIFMVCSAINSHLMSTKYHDDGIKRA